MDSMAANLTIQKKVENLVKKELDLSEKLNLLLDTANLLREYGLWNPKREWNNNSKVNFESYRNDFTCITWGRYKFSPIKKASTEKDGIYVREVVSNGGQDAVEDAVVYSLEDFYPVFDKFEEEFYNEANRLVNELN